jgi:hypothetical protein
MIIPKPCYQLQITPVPAPELAKLDTQIRKCALGTDTPNDIMYATSAHYGLCQLEPRLPDLQTTTLLTHTIIGIVTHLDLQHLTNTLDLCLVGGAWPLWASMTLAPP